MKDGKYEFTQDVPTHIVQVLNQEKTLWIPTPVKGVTPFGKHTGVLTEDKLSDSVAEYLLTKPEWACYITEKKSSKSK